MSWYATELHKFVTGETRTDGWKSGWRIDFERRSAEDAAKPRRILKAAQIVERRRQSLNKRPNSYYFKRECSVCAAPIRQSNKTGRCIKHKLERPQPLESAYICGSCDKSIRKTEFGLCKRCFIRYRRLIEQADVRICAVLGCSYSLNKNTIYTKCRKHSRADRTAREVIRQRGKRAELKQAA